MNAVREAKPAEPLVHRDTEQDAETEIVLCVNFAPGLGDGQSVVFGPMLFLLSPPTVRAAGAQMHTRSAYHDH